MSTEALKQPDTLAAAITRAGLVVNAEFVPFSKSRNAKEKSPSLNWRVTICRRSPLDGQDNPILTTDYSAGCAHCPAYKAKGLGIPNSILRTEAINWECENGKTSAAALGRNFMGGKPLLPNTVDVIYSLITDADVLNYSSFEDWASNFGYDADSRKAEAIYRDCLAIALKLRNALGDKAFADLQQSAQDY